MDISIFKEYLTELDSVDKHIIDTRVTEKGIEGYLSQQLIYLDCSRIIKGMRMMQTVGYPYKREISSYLYVIHNCSDIDYNIIDDKHNCEYWENKLLERHQANLEYEKENPPIIYDELKPTKTSKVKRKAKEGDLFPKERKTKAERKQETIQQKINNLGFAGFKLKIHKT